MSVIYLIVSYIAAFVLGLYASSQFRYNEPIELQNWIVALFILCVFGILSIQDK